jgi:hypothetical protein
MFSLLAASDWKYVNLRRFRLILVGVETHHSPVETRPVEADRNAHVCLRFCQYEVTGTSCSNWITSVGITRMDEILMY